MRMVLGLDLLDGETLVTVKVIFTTEDTGEHRVEQRQFGVVLVGD